jgi:hypothetical protein
MTDLLLRLLKYACPLLLLVLPCVIAFGLIAPWPVAVKELGSGAASGALLIGASYESRFSGSTSYEKREQTYALLPGLRTVTVIQENGVVRTEEDPNGLLSVTAIYALLGVGTWWFWFRSKKQVAH